MTVWLVLSGGAMQKNYYILFAFVFWLQADDVITVHNKTRDFVFTRIYCVPSILGGQKAEAGLLYELASRSAVDIIRPDKRISCTRNLAFATSADELPDEMDKRDFEGLPSIGIGISSAGRVFDNFYVLKDRFGNLKTFNTLTWQPYKLLDDYQQDLLKTYPLVQQNPHQHDHAQVRVGDTVSQGEQQYVTTRSPKVQEALERFLQRKLNGTYIPKIAFVNSGGGERAFISSLGWHIGAQKIGLLDAAMYDIGLSGGAWFVLTWMMSLKDPQSFKDLMKPLLAKDMIDSVSDPQSRSLFLDALLARDGLEQPITVVNAWGALVANRYLAFTGDLRQQLLFSDYAKYVELADNPFPIVVSVSGFSQDITEMRHQMHWFEWTPYEASGIGNWLGNAHIPTWAFGRTYKDNVSVDTKPEYDVGLLMGICGSAFAFSYARAYQEIIHNSISDIPVFGPFIRKIADIFVDKILPDDVSATALTKRLSVSKAPNFAQNVLASTVQGKELRFIDAGLAFNLPVSAALARKADVLFVFDASGGKIGGELQYVAKHAQEYNYAFPTISTEGIDQRAITIFEDIHKEVPLVIYMPRIDPTGFIDTNFSTAKFQYEDEEFQQLSGITEVNMINSTQQIKQALIKLIESHDGFA